MKITKEARELIAKEIEDRCQGAVVVTKYTKATYYQPEEYYGVCIDPDSLIEAAFEKIEKQYKDDGEDYVISDVDVSGEIIGDDSDREYYGSIFICVGDESGKYGFEVNIGAEDGVKDTYYG